MRIAIAISTSAMLLVHALGGCWSLCGSNCAQCHTAPTASSPACCHDHHGDDAEADDTHHLPSAPCKCKLECQSTCISLPPEKVSLDDSATLLPLANVQSALNPQDFFAVIFAHGSPPGDLPEREAPSRLHLAYQVLQI